jgi:putative transposase
MLATREGSQLAQRLIRETIEKQEVFPDQLVIHSDRGPSMKSHGVAQLLATLGVTKSHSRDNSGIIRPK